MKVETVGEDRIVVSDIENCEELCCLLEEIRMTIDFLDVLNGLEAGAR